MKPFFLILILLAVSAVAVADVCIKKAALEGSILGAMKNPWFLAAIALYLFQVFIFTSAFVFGWKLSIVGMLQTVSYAAIVLGSGVFIFHEHLTVLQWIGIVFAFGATILMNLKI